MAHHIKSRFIAVTNGVRPIWANLGVEVSEAQTLEQALKLSGLDFTLADAPIYTNWSKTGLQQIPDYKAIVRLDTHEAMGKPVGKDFGTVQPIEAFRFLDTLAESNEAHYISAGLLDNARMFILMRIPNADFEVTDGDRHEIYTMFAQGFDGSMANIAKITETRVECQNTMLMALAGQGAVAKIKHTKNVMQRLEAAKDLLSGIKQNSETIAEKLRLLAKRPVKRAHVEETFKRLFPVNAEAEKQSRRDNILQEILDRFESNDGNAFPEQRGTAYNLLNAITGYTDHQRSSKSNGHTQEYKRSESAMFGSGEQLKSQAFEVIYQLTDGTKEVRTETRYVPETSTETPSSLLDDILSQSKN